MSLPGKLGYYWSAARGLGPTTADRLRIFWFLLKNVRVRLGMARHHPSRVRRIETVYGRIHVRDNFGDITNVPNLLHRQVYRTAAAVGEGAILDVGANVGMAAVWFAKRYPGRPIHCFEPLEENVRMIRLNSPTAHVNQVGAGRARSTIELGVDRDGVMATSIPWEHATTRRRLDVIRLDDYVREHGIDRVALLKIDTEGMELDVLAGATETLARTGVVVMETHGAERHARTLEILGEAGFAIEGAEFDGATGMVAAHRDAPAERPE